MSGSSRLYEPIDNVEQFTTCGNGVNTTSRQNQQILEQRDANNGSKKAIKADTNKYCYGQFCYVLAYVILVLAISSAVFVLKQENDSNYAQLNQRIQELQNELHNTEQNSVIDYQSVLDQLSSINSHEMSFENSTTVLLRTHQNMLTRLSNGTSNADVLDKMRQTADKVNEQLLMAQVEMKATMASATRNVSVQLQKSTDIMQQTQNDVDSRLNATFSKMENVVSLAATNILGVQQNVSTQLTVMRASLGVTVDDLNSQVQSAQDIIRDEVAAVKANIDQYVVVTNQQFAAENDFVKYQLAGTFTLLGCLISLWHLTSHLRHYYKPDVQRRVMAVLWMVPIYSITSWLSLVLPSAEPVLGAVRDCYEAYVIYTFIALLVAILEDGKGVKTLIGRLAMHVVEEREVAAQALLANPRAARLKEHIKPPFACCYVAHRPSSVASAWLYQCKLMAMQFVMLKPVLTIVPLIITLSGYRLDALPLVVNNAPNWQSPQLYILFMQNLSVAVAFWGLLSFYHGAEKDLAWCDPWPKFLCIKGVVFATFWQALTIQFMSSAGFVDPRTGSQIQNLLICIEMLLASLAHFYIFPYQEWADDYKREREKGLMLRDTLALRDFVKDMRDMVTTWDPHEAATTGAGDIHGSGGLLMEEESRGLLTEEEMETEGDSGDRPESPDLESGYFQFVDSPERIAEAVRPPRGSQDKAKFEGPGRVGSSSPHPSRELEMLIRSDSDATRTHYSAISRSGSFGGSGDKRPVAREEAAAVVERAQRELLAKLQLLESGAPVDFTPCVMEVSTSRVVDPLGGDNNGSIHHQAATNPLHARRSLSYSSDSSGEEEEADRRPGGGEGDCEVLRSVPSALFCADNKIDTDENDSRVVPTPHHHLEEDIDYEAV